MADTMRANLIMTLTLPPSATLSGKEFTWIVASYCIGCVTAGYYWVKWRTGQDIRRMGSGNPGARNVGRFLGVPGFTVTLLLDVGKGMFVSGMAWFLGLSPVAVVASIVAAAVGHNWPMQLRFQGGKGVAVSMGALLVYDPFVVGCLVALFVPALFLLRRFTLSGMAAFALGPLVVFLSGRDNYAVVTVSILAVLILWTHRRNIREELGRLLPHREWKGGTDGKRGREGSNEER